MNSNYKEKKKKYKERIRTLLNDARAARATDRVCMISVNVLPFVTPAQYAFSQLANIDLTSLIGRQDSWCYNCSDDPIATKDVIFALKHGRIRGKKSIK